MKFVLYLSFKLTGNRIYPTCPRPSYLSGNTETQIILLPSQFEIAKQTLKSYQKLEPDYLYLNIDLGLFDTLEYRNEFRELVTSLFPLSSIIELNWTRPEQVVTWLAQADKIYGELGQDALVLASWNHDHPLVEQRLDSIKRLKRKALTVLSTLGASSSLFCITHQPESLAKISKFFSVASKNNLKDGLELISVSDELVFAERDVDHEAQGLFLCKPQYLVRMWSSLLVCNRNIPSYVPRPDFPGVPVPSFRENVTFGLNEYLAHYDGYTHNSSLAKFMPGVTFYQQKPFVLIECDNVSKIGVQETFKRLYYKCISDFIRANRSHQHIMYLIYFCANLYIVSHWCEVSAVLEGLGISTKGPHDLGAGYGSVRESLLNWFYTLVLEDYPYLVAAALIES